MSRKRAILLAAFIVVVVLFMAERATRHDPARPAKVTAITGTPSISGERETQDWTLEVTLPDGSSGKIPYYGIKPNRSIGEPLCVIEKRRNWGPTTYIVTSQTDC